MLKTPDLRPCDLFTTACHLSVSNPIPISMCIYVWVVLPTCQSYIHFQSMYEAHTEMGKSRVCSELPTAWLGRTVYGSRAEEGPPARGLRDG